MNLRIKKSNNQNNDGSRNTIVREDNVIREYGTGTNAPKIRETIYPTNAAARRDMATA